jgi:hypothetical protein
VYLFVKGLLDLSIVHEDLLEVEVLEGAEVLVMKVTYPLSVFLLLTPVMALTLTDTITQNYKSLLFK